MLDIHTFQKHLIITILSCLLSSFSLIWVRNQKHFFPIILHRADNFSRCLGIPVEGNWIMLCSQRENDSEPAEIFLGGNLIYATSLFNPSNQPFLFFLFNCALKDIYSCCVLVSKLCPTLLQPHGLQPARLPVHGISQARILEWVAMPSSRGSSWPRDWTQVSCIGT